MFPCGTRIKLKRDSFKPENKPEPNKRRWTGSNVKPVCAVNPPVDGGSPKPATADPDFSSKVELRRLRSEERSRKRSVKNACCALCGDVKYNPPPPPSSKNLVRLLNPRPRAGRPSLSAEKQRTPSASRHASALEKNPTVKLCDVGRVFRIASRDFSCVLPAVLKQTASRRAQQQCLQTEFGVLTHPHPHSIRKRRRSRKLSTATKHSCASLSSGDAPCGGAHISEGSLEESDACLVEDPETMRLSESPDTVAPACANNCPEKQKHCPVNHISGNTSSPERRVPPLVLRRVSVNGFGFRSEDDDRESGPDEDGRNQDSDAESANAPESFSCQRTQAYIFIPKSSCARTCKPWPFPRTGPPEELRSPRNGARWIITATFTNTAQDDEEKNERSEAAEEVYSRKSHADTPCRLISGDIPDVLNQQSSVLCENTSTCVLKRTSGFSVTAISEHAELNQSQEHSTEQVNSCKLDGCGFEASLEANGLLRHHSLLDHEDHPDAPGVWEPADHLVGDSKCAKFSILPISQFEDQSRKADEGAVYNPALLSQMCIKVGVLKAQDSSSVDQTEGESAAHSHSSNPEGEVKPASDGQTHTDMSSEEENQDAGGVSAPSSSSSDDDDDDDGVCSMNTNNNNNTQACSQSHRVEESFLDVSRAYEEDVLVLDVIQDDPELFGTVVSEAKTQQDAPTKNQDTLTKMEDQHCEVIWEQHTEGTSKVAEDVQTDHLSDSGSKVNEMQVCRSQPVQSLNTVKSENAGIDCNNNQPSRDSSNLNSISVISSRAPRPVTDSCFSGREVTAKEPPALRTPHISYCRFYFSDHSTCLRSGVCRFLHVPRDGDETFCMEMVKKFCHAGKVVLILRAVEVFMGYYSRCPPSGSFSQETVNSLLSILLNMGLLREFLAVLNLLLTHKKLPPPELVLAVFKFASDRRLINFVPELILLTSKIVESGCVFTVDQCEVMQSHLHLMQVPRQQMDIFMAVKCRALATNPHTSELSHLTQAVVRVEMLKQQEDWSGLALVFYSVCSGSHSNNELLRFCCCVTMALLKEPKDKHTVPYELFADAVCQREPSDEVKSILGRIGVSLIFRYHRTREWSKGVKLVNVMLRLQIEFIMQKGLMGNEHRVSRCQLVSMAAELFLHSGSIEGALKLLRADGWFVSSSVWPCEAADVEIRKRVLTLLAGKTSHRDAFEILTNLPGLRQPINGVQISDYTDMFNAHLRVCLLKQTLPVAADILEFMLTRSLVPETQQLQNLIHRLGKQNMWSRARALFRRARSAGFYSSVVCEADALFLPCGLSEIEMTLAFEMFITFINSSLSAHTHPLLITLRRQAGVENVTESVYLAAGCRLLSAALIPNPKLSIRYTAVNQQQEQLFTLDRASAHKWILQNSCWALEVWAS
ncbi:protein TOPAZ1 isoform X4 [Danio rerio]|uniref:Protein TOPAZ1 isoform X4 n=1 Tax=Danio rerio TaxID=7955 RepID=A0AC58I1E5_DANRE